MEGLQTAVGDGWVASGAESGGTVKVNGCKACSQAYEAVGWGDGCKALTFTGCKPEVAIPGEVAKVNYDALAGESQLVQLPSLSS